MEPLSSILFSLYRGTPYHGAWLIACLENRWSNIIGERLSRVCRPSHFKDSELVIEILDDSWEEALRSVSQDLLEKLRVATTGDVMSLTLVLKRRLT